MTRKSDEKLSIRAVALLKKRKVLRLKYRENRQAVLSQTNSKIVKLSRSIVLGDDANADEFLEEIRKTLIEETDQLILLKKQYAAKMQRKEANNVEE